MLKKCDNTLREFKGYERHEAVIAVNDLDFKIKYKNNCINCPEYGKNLSCPPYSPSFKDFVGSRKMAKVICFRTPLDYFDHLPKEKRARMAYDEMSSLLGEILMKERSQGKLVAGAGACKACRDCPIEKEGMICIKPEKQIFSLESLGVNLSSLIEMCFPFKLEWIESQYAARHICAVGACFFDG